MKLGQLIHTVIGNILRDNVQDLEVWILSLGLSDLPTYRMF